MYKEAIKQRTQDFEAAAKDHAVSFRKIILQADGDLNYYTIMQKIRRQSLTPLELELMEDSLLNIIEKNKLSKKDFKPQRPEIKELLS